MSLTWSSRAASRVWWGLASSSDGKKMIAAVRGGQIWRSIDSGVTWNVLSSTLSGGWQCVASSSDGTILFAGLYDGGSTG
jgi:hypothetical protein